MSSEAKQLMTGDGDLAKLSQKDRIIGIVANAIMSENHKGRGLEQFTMDIAQRAAELALEAIDRDVEITGGAEALNG